MGGQLSCIRKSSGEEKDDRKDKSNKYEEIDDNFVIVTNNPKSDDGVDCNYENVTSPNCPTETTHPQSQSISKPTNEIRAGAVGNTTTNNNNNNSNNHHHQQPQSTKSKAKAKGKENEANENVEYTQVIKTKKSQTSSMKKPPKPPKLKEKPKKTPAPPSEKENQKQLNYVEVEFTAPPVVKKAAPSTTYTDVIHDGGRMFLVQN